MFLLLGRLLWEDVPELGCICRMDTNVCNAILGTTDDLWGFPSGKVDTCTCVCLKIYCALHECMCLSETGSNLPVSQTPAR